MRTVAAAVAVSGTAVTLLFVGGPWALTFVMAVVIAVDVRRTA